MQANNEEIVNLLLQGGADVHATTRSGDTALHWAAYDGNPTITLLLLEAGANVDAIGDLGNRPLHIATSKSFEQVCKGQHVCLSQACYLPALLVAVL